MHEQHITADRAGERADVALARLLPAYSRSFWGKRCAEGRVTSAGVMVRSSQRLKLNQVLTVTLQQVPDFTGKTLPIIYEDDDVLVVDKPAGMLTHAKGVVSDEYTVADFVRTHTTDGLDTNRPGIVHRLDRGTSGVLIAAKTPQARLWLQKQFSQRKVKKAYIALVKGHLQEPTAELVLPIGRHPRQPQTFRVHPSGKAAVTTYEVLREYQHASLVLLKPLTGRTHQLRVHMAHLGHPIVGDAVYGQPNAALGRFFLHAASLELTLPSGQRRTFAAAMPKELQHYLENLEHA